MKFDPRAAKLLKDGDKLNIDGCPGLRLVASASRRTWTYRFKSPIDGNMRQVKIGEWPVMPVGAATAEWERLRAARDAGRDPALEKRAERRTEAAIVPQVAPDTVRAICDAYLKGHVDKRRKPKGAAEVRRTFDKMLGPLATKRAADLTRRDAFALIEGYAHIPVQAGNLKRELGAAWDYALDAGRLPESTPNWWRQIMRGKLRSDGKTIAGEKIGVVKRVLSAAELGELIRWLPNFSRLVEEILTMYLWTGCRGAEICAIRFEEVSETPSGLLWTIPKAKTKNARHEGATDQRVPLVGRAEKIIRRRMGTYEGGYLFPNDKGHTEQKLISESVYFRQPYCEIRNNWERARLTVTRWSPHDLRRSVRTLLSALGCQHEVAEAILGHMTPGVGGIYNLYRYDPERREWLTRLDAELERLAAATCPQPAAPSPIP
jgi:integrase